MKNKGYHLTNIKKGKFGELSKIFEEIEEIKDADKQNAKLMILIELSDLYGAIEGYLKTHFKDVSMKDIKKMSKITQRVFKNGIRK